jgi:hypothetical protein
MESREWVGRCVLPGASDAHAFENASGPGFRDSKSLDDVMNRHGFAMGPEVLLGAQALLWGDRSTAQARLACLFGDLRFGEPHSADLLGNGVQGSRALSVCREDSELLNGDRSMTLADQIRQTLFVFR